jgi:hypothetical protein
MVGMAVGQSAIGLISGGNPPMGNLRPQVETISPEEGEFWGAAEELTAYTRYTNIDESPGTEETAEAPSDRGGNEMACPRAGRSTFCPNHAKAVSWVPRDAPHFQRMRPHSCGDQTICWAPESLNRTIRRRARTKHPACPRHLQLPGRWRSFRSNGPAPIPAGLACT